MDDLTQSQAESLKKLSTERLRSRLVKAGHDEDLVFATERPDLLTMMAECILKPQVADPSPEIRNREMYFREQEFRLREKELREQAAARELQRQELELRRAELRMSEQRAVDELEFRRAEAERLRARD